MKNTDCSCACRYYDNIFPTINDNSWANFPRNNFWNMKVSTAWRVRDLHLPWSLSPRSALLWSWLLQIKFYFHLMNWLWFVQKMRAAAQLLVDSVRFGGYLNCWFSSAWELRTICAIQLGSMFNFLIILLEILTWNHYLSMYSLVCQYWTLSHNHQSTSFLDIVSMSKYTSLHVKKKQKDRYLSMKIINYIDISI